MYLRHREGTALEVLVKADLSDTGAILVNIPTEQAPLRVTAQASMRLREESTMLENLNTFRQETRPTGKEPSAQRRSPSVRAVAAGRRPPAKRCKSDVAMKEPTTHTVERSNSTCTIHFKIAQPAEEPLGLQQKRVPLGRWILGSRSRRRKRGDGGTR
jgi:hypothetical protein